MQIEVFALESGALKEGKPMPSTSRIKQLSPSLKEHGLLSVGGRLQ